MAERVERAQPFIKWAGGKRWLGHHLGPLICQSERRHVEPFLGSGAVFFAACPQSALLADANEELVNAFLVCKGNPEGLIEGLLKLRVLPKEFSRVRDSIPQDPLERA